MRRRLAALAVAGSAAVAGCAVGDPQPSQFWEVTDNSATLHANVYSSFAGDTEYWWRYGTTTSYGNETTHETVAIADSDPHPVTASLSDLTAGTTYHFQLCARDEEESPPRTVCSTDRTFTTDPEPDGSFVAYASDRDNSNDDIFVVDSNGNHPVNLTDNSDFETTPTWSPDRTQIAYSGDGGIHVMDSDGTDDATLPGTSDAFDPAWSPDGDRIAFARDGGGFSEIWAMDPDGSNQTELTNNPVDVLDSGPSWSPDGGAIAFGRSTFVEPTVLDEICIVSAGGGAVGCITDFGVEPDWSPDGDRIAFTAFVSDWEIYAVDTDGSDLENLTEEPDSVDTSPAWSPDGTRIAYERIAPGNDWTDVYVMDADGTDKVNFTPGDDTVDDREPDWSTLP